MNRDSHLIFEAYLQEMATRLVPGKAGEASGTQVAFPPKSIGKYDLTPEQTKAVIEAVVSKLEEMGGSSDLSDKEFQVQVIAPAVKELAKKSGTNSGYAARVIHTALKAAGVLTSEQGEVSIEDASSEAQDEAADDVPEVAAKTPPTEAEKSEDVSTSSPIARQLFDVIQPGGTDIDDVKSEVNDRLRKSGNVDLVKDIGKKIKELVRVGVLELKGRLLDFGDKADEYQKDDYSLVNASPEEYAEREFGYNARPTHGGSFWASQE